MIQTVGTAAPAAGRPARKRGDETTSVVNALAEQREDAALLAIRQVAFNNELQQNAEMAREANALRDLQLEQAKRDDEVVKKYIGMI